MSALEARYDALLTLGRHGEAVVELERTTEEHPLREGFARRLMVALYRCDRQADALRVFSRTRSVLAEELGLDPSPALVELQTAILTHDPNLNASAGPTAPPPRRRRQRRQQWPSPSRSLPRPRRHHPCRCRARSCGRRRRRSWGARPISARCTASGRRPWAATGISPCSPAKPAPASPGWRPRFASDVHSMGGIVLWGGRPRTPSCRSSRWSRRCAPRCARCRPRRPRASPPIAGSSCCCCQSWTIWFRGAARRPDPSVERYLLFETVADCSTANRGSIPSSSCSTTCNGPTRRPQDDRTRHPPRADVAHHGGDDGALTRRRSGARAGPGRRHARP